MHDNICSIDKEEFKQSVLNYIKYNFAKTIDTSTKEDIFTAVAITLRNHIMENWVATQNTYSSQNTKQMYYLSSEFLMGRALGNNIINLNAENTIKEVLRELGVDYNLIEDTEPDAGLGNGGLGRLAACFLDSLATLQLPGHGCSIKYRYGIFEQKIIDGYQVEYPDKWLELGNVWLLKRQDEAVEVKFGGYVDVHMETDGRNHFHRQNYASVLAVPYDMPILGYKNNTVNTLRLWDAEAINKFDLNSFDRGDYFKAVEAQNLAETITQVLYPNDNHYQGKELRLKQQYFFVSASIQSAVRNYKKNNSDLLKLHEKVTFQLNDTHPTVAIAELMRILIDTEGLEWSDAWSVTTQACAYTNHTILSEALEKWPVELFSRLLPRVYQIIEEINRRFCLDIMKAYPEDSAKLHRMAIISDGYVRMAYLAIVGSYSVNGVAALHTDILKKQELKDFYDFYPQKFNNKTNGITQRRWLLESNSELSSLITNTINSDKWTTDLFELKKLEAFVSDKEFLNKFMQVKHQKKVQLANYIREHNGVEINPNSIFDIHVKRLHEYKRQLLNLLHVIHLYQALKSNPSLSMYPRTFIFAAKAAPGYRRAKLIIKLINSVAETINNDPEINDKIKVVFLENFNVSLGKLVYPAADVSEQISTASKEASGTGNMKFTLNGAMTLGTLDGANVEILEEVGAENIFIFGLKADEVINYEKNGGYNPWDMYNSNEDIKSVLNSLINGAFSSNDPELFREIYDSLLNGGDTYFLLKDFESYKNAQKEIEKAYQDTENWAKMCVLNIARVGKFSSDRTILEYTNDIWHLSPVEVKL